MTKNLSKIAALLMVIVGLSGVGLAFLKGDEYDYCYFGGIICLSLACAILLLVEAKEERVRENEIRRRLDARINGKVNNKPSPLVEEQLRRQRERLGLNN